MRVLRFVLLGACLASLAACDSLREEAGLTKAPPDEFAVTTKAPLIVPPDFNLRPPSPGAAPLNQTDPTSAAEAAMFNNSDPQTVASQMQGNYSTSEKMLLANAGTQNSDPTIRADLQSDERNMQGADPSFTDRILGSPAKKAPPRKGGAPVNDSDDGWFGGLFDWF
jgi:hypothetical protein